MSSSTAGSPAAPQSPSGRPRGCLGTVSRAGSWMSLLGAGLSWGLSSLFLVVGLLALGGHLDWLIWDVGTTADGEDDLILFLFEFIVLGVLMIGFVVVVFLGVLLPALLAGTFHLVGIVSSVGALAARGEGGGSRLGGLASLFIHLGGVGAAILWFLFWILTVAGSEASSTAPI